MSTDLYREVTDECRSVEGGDRCIRICAGRSSDVYRSVQVTDVYRSVQVGGRCLQICEGRIDVYKSVKGGVQDGFRCVQICEGR